MTDKERKSKIADILLEFYEEYQCNMPNRPMIPSIYAGKILDSLPAEPVSPCVECASISEGCKEICYDYNKWARDNHKEESVSEELEDFALQYAGHHAPYDDCMQEVEDAIKAGAKWDREKTINKTCEWIKSMWSETDDRFKDDYTGMLIEDFKKYMEGE